MPNDESPEHGTLIIAALLLLGLFFSGYWIYTYVEPDSDPNALLPWFGAAAAAILVWGFLVYGLRGWKRRN